MMQGFVQNSADCVLAGGTFVKREIEFYFSNLRGIAKAKKLQEEPPCHLLSKTKAEEVKILTKTF
jgi:hypothetical protein